MAAKINLLKKDFGMTDEDLKKYGILKSPMLSGRVSEEEKEKLVNLSLKKDVTQSEIIRKELNKQLSNKEIDWDSVKILKGESLKGRKTMSLRVKVDEKTEKKVIKLCHKNRVSISSFVRYVLVMRLKEEEK